MAVSEGGAASAQNGRKPNGYWTLWMEPKTLLALVGILAACGAWYFSVQGHCADDRVHHTITYLDDRYVNEETYDIQQCDIKETLQRLETKMDRVADKVGVVP